jgi:hypothetical protein
MPGPKKPLRILCFGDSLTSGYYGMGTGCRPYSITFEEKLSSAFPDRDVKVTENGMPGDVVSFKAFNQRLDEECMCRSSVPIVSLSLTSPPVRRTAVPYDWVIILGGTK